MPTTTVDPSTSVIVPEIKEQLSPEERQLRKEAKERREKVCAEHLAAALPANLEGGIYVCEVEDKASTITFPA